MIASSWMVPIGQLLRDKELDCIAVVVASSMNRDGLSCWHVQYQDGNLAGNFTLDVLHDIYDFI